MNDATIRIPTPLRAFTGGKSEVGVQASTVDEALQALGRSHEGVLQRILDQDGQLRGFVNIYVGEKSIRALGGLKAALPPDAVLSIVPAVAGGRG